MTGSSTIAAIATGGAPGGIGVVRVSGPAALDSARAVASALPASPTPRHAYFTPLVDAGGRVLDEGLALYFAAPASFTGEDVVELQAHGAPRLLSLLLEGVLRHPSVRLAEPGEFTRRAFLNGRLDLARAEAVADLVAAESEAQVRAAAAQLSGQLSGRLAAVRQPLVALHADLEGVLDFPDEAEGADAELVPRLAAVRADVEALLADGRAGALVRRGARVVLYGPVNAGKSTLFNRLVGAARALVDPEPGTTRDVLEARIELGGLAVTLVDTAGLRGDPGRLEALGIARAREALQGADVAVLLVPPESTREAVAAWRAEAPDAVRLEVISKVDQPGAMALTGARSRDAEAAGATRLWLLSGGEIGGLPGSRDAEAADAAQLGPRGRGAMANEGTVLGSGVSVAGGAKAREGALPSSQDAGAAGAAQLEPKSESPAGVTLEGALPVSGETGLGVDALQAALTARLAGGVSGAVRVTSERHLDALRRAADALERAQVAATASTLEVVSGEVGLALAALADITGEDVSSELLDAIFARFCIGK